MHYSDTKLYIYMYNNRDNARIKQKFLKFGYGINYKYEGTLSHSFDRFYVVTIFELPKEEYLKLTTISYDSNCQYLDNARNLKDYLTELIQDTKNCLVKITRNK